MINKQYYQKGNYFIWDTMEYCSRQCIRRTLYAVMFGVSPIIICLLLIFIARIILHCLEMSYNRRQKPIDRRRTSSMFHQQVGRSTISYTPVSITELQRIIQGDYYSQRPSESSSSFFNNDHNSSKTPNFMKGILTRRESSPPPLSNALANLVIRRNAINSTPMTALFAPVSTPTSPTFDTINEQNTRRPSVMTIKHESIETTTTLATLNNNNNSNTIFYNTNDTWESEPIETDSLVTLPKTMTTTTTTTTVVVEEFLDFHSVHSIPYSLNLVNSI